ncbi:hypothetical protein H0A36_19355 [Endozoicomonas sp. SM1973]|uniref:Uncharacterized protein n=1 Tax=Spartinivicinus marinus TaxID=2994442 RepID=A0A853I620_9GAMM|nr:hypothetical protein [Spartinivicinus marinus]MCX4029339.1 hypothetical protein [Spartinivicinus marinus]NYZ68179.1 hypothetical protein [Spartinivicinus marinus]
MFYTFTHKPVLATFHAIHKQLLILPLFLLLLMCFVGNAVGDEANPPGKGYTNRIIVKFHASKNTLIVEDYFLQWSYQQGFPLTYVKTLGTGANVYRLNEYKSAADLEQIIDLVLTHYYIEYAEPDWIMTPVYSEPDTTSQQLKLNQQWHLNQQLNQSTTIALLAQGYPQQTSPDLLAGLQISHQQEGGYCRTTRYHHNIVATALTSLLLNQTDSSRSINLLPIKLGNTCQILASELVEGIIWASGVSLPGYPKNQHPAQAIVLPIALQGRCSRQLQWAIDIANSNGSVVISAQPKHHSAKPSRLLTDCRGLVPIELFTY